MNYDHHLSNNYTLNVGTFIFLLPAQSYNSVGFNKHRKLLAIHIEVTVQLSKICPAFIRSVESVLYIY